MKNKEMICDICKKVVKPLDAHMGKLDGRLITTHIDCWNKEVSEYIAKEVNMLSNKTIEVIRSQMKIMLALINGETEGAEKARKDITSALSEFNDFVNEFEDEQREFE